MVKSALRVLEVFELFEAEQRAMRVSEIVDKLDLPQSSVSMLLKTLVSQGYVDFDPDTREFSPSIRLSFLGHWAVGSPDRREAIHRAMRQLCDETGESALLGRQIGLHMQYLAVIESPRARRFTLHPGLMRPAHRTGIGLVLLSQKSDDEISRMVRRFNAEDRNAERYTALDEVMVAIRSTRRLGYAETDSLTTPGGGTIAMLLPVQIRGQSLGIAIGGAVARLQARRDEILDALTRAVGALHAHSLDRRRGRRT